MSLPTAMTFIETARPGGPEVLVAAEGPVPAPRAGEVLIRVAAAGVNRVDVLQRQGVYPPPPGASPILGLEVAGEVAALGDGVSAWGVGDRVCALVNAGGYAEYCAAPAPQCLPWPRGYDAVRAAALPEAMFTVWANLFGLGRLKAGERVLIHGGTSGIGTTAIQLARAFGATVLATAGGPEKRAACLDLGADAAIDYKSEDFVARVGELTGGQGVDAVLDIVGGPYLARNLACLAMRGRLVLVGFQGGSMAEGLDIGPILRRHLTVAGSTMRPRSVDEKGGIARELLETVWPILDRGGCGPAIDSVVPLAEAAKAHARMEGGRHIGKIVLTTGRPDDA